MQRLTVRFHARAAELARARECEIHLAEDASGGELKDEIARRWPALEGLLGACALASDTEFLADESRVCGRGVLHLIPPVSGG